MPTLPWRSSLSFRLALTLSAAVAALWLLSSSIALFLDFRDTREALMHRLESVTADRAFQISEELGGVKRDVQTLGHNWATLPEDVGNDQETHLAARFVANAANAAEGSRAPSAQTRRALAFAEIYGSGGLGNYVDTFVILKDGVALSDANTPLHSDAEQQARWRALVQTPEQDGLHWGDPFHNPTDGRWYLQVATRDAASGTLVGVTVQLSRLFGRERLVDPQQGALVWLGADAQALTPLPAVAPPELLAALPDCAHPYFQRVGEVHAVCRNIAPTGWRLVLLYPANQITAQALATLPKRVPLALLELLSLLGLLYVVLHRTLDRNLEGFVHVISPQAAVSEQQRLPEDRPDELGRIANAYNRLLDAVKAQYGELEAKVVERTVALNEARERAERASANKSEQITSISHEFRTPLNGIVGALTLLDRTPCSDDQRDLIDTGLKCSVHLMEIINNLLDFSRIESGQMVVVPASQDPLTLLDHAMLTVQLPALTKGLTLTCQAEASLPLALHTDGLRVRQILINLLGNAVKFTPTGNIALCAWSADGRVYFRVHDSGPGISAQQASEVFAAFRQLDSHAPGSGLGLAIARSLARLLGGDLRLVPVTRGACFELELPLGDDVPGAATPQGVVVAPAALHAQLAAWGYMPQFGENARLAAPELAYLPGRLRQRLAPEGSGGDVADESLPMCAWRLQVLVVDDVATNREIVGRMLREQGHDVHLAASGQEALALGRAHIFDVVFMDMRMPGLSGAETVAQWRDDASGTLDAGSPIIALTANAQPGERERLLGEGFDEYITKPVSPATLARAVDFASDLQLQRGAELEPNTASTPSTLASDPALLARLGDELRLYHQRLGEAHGELVASGSAHAAAAGPDRAECLRLLHTLKGLAGQAGLERLHQAAAHWESLLQAGEPTPPQAWEAFGRLIEIELGAETA
ncbi:hybrid sensor histidine kinase/response regulator [Pandoraea sputorum]|uniref:histidine kinase n=2 Tax=Pandoraea sputorum TaxID=93222 RepID=A0A5E5BJ05_9BURK|nr:hybrid sensor histidine kinase/response regulator [Pandoraea sputorum]